MYFNKRLRQRLLKIFKLIFFIMFFFVIFEYSIIKLYRPNVGVKLPEISTKNSLLNKQLSNTLITNCPENKKDEEYPFFYNLDRLKNIFRWLRYNRIKEESVSDHCFDVALFAFMIALIYNKYFEGSVNPEKAAFYGMLHDAPEAITGDIVSQTKHSSKEMEEQCHNVEKDAINLLASQVPEEFREIFSKYLGNNDPIIKKIVKLADLFSAMKYCYKEKSLGNNSFDKCISRLKGQLKEFSSKAGLEGPVNYFSKHFMLSFGCGDLSVN